MRHLPGEAPLPRIRPAHPGAAWHLGRPQRGRAPSPERPLGPSGVLSPTSGSPGKNPKDPAGPDRNNSVPPLRQPATRAGEPVAKARFEGRSGPFACESHLSSWRHEDSRTAAIPLSRVLATVSGMPTGREAGFLGGCAVELDGGHVEFGIGGQGLPVLFLPGWALGWRAYRRALKRLVSLGCRVHAPSLPGVGRSSALPSGQDTLAGLAAWADRFLRRRWHRRTGPYCRSQLGRGRRHPAGLRFPFENRRPGPGQPPGRRGVEGRRRWGTSHRRSSVVGLGGEFSYGLDHRRRRSTHHRLCFR